MTLHHWTLAPGAMVPVYDRADGVRVHVCGLVRLPDGTTVSAFRWPEIRRFDLAGRIEPKPRRRAMLWAQWVADGVHVELLHNMARVRASAEDQAP